MTQEETTSYNNIVNDFRDKLKKKDAHIENLKCGLRAIQTLGNTHKSGEKFLSSLASTTLKMIEK